MPLRAATVDIESVVLSWARHTPCTLHAQWRQTWPAFNLPRQARCWPLNNTFLCMRIIIIDENEGLGRYRFRFGQMMSSISRVHRPRGSEAYMVIIVPFNTMAKYSVCWDYELFFFFCVSVCIANKIDWEWGAGQLSWRPEHKKVVVCDVHMHNAVHCRGARWYFHPSRLCAPLTNTTRIGKLGSNPKQQRKENKKKKK